MSTDAHNLTQMPSVETSLVEEGLGIGKKELALQKAGATREVAYAVMVKGLTAKKMTVDKFGEEHWEEDTTNQLKASEMVSRLNGDLRNETTSVGTVVNISVDATAVQGLMAMVSDVSAQLASLRESGRQTGEIIDVTIS